MNFLAHCFLSCSNENILIGNFITDFISKKQEADYSNEILAGIHLHRKIDDFTDKHPASLELRKMLRPRHRKYSSVVVDLIWDYYLSQNWSHYSGEDLESFASNIYKILTKHKDIFPNRLKSKIDMMVADDFLLAYSNLERMSNALGWMDRRVKFPSNFIGAIEDIAEYDKKFEELFSDFFPSIICFVDAECKC